MNLPFKGLIAGAAGAIVLTALHEATRRTRPRAPRLDVLGMRSLTKIMRAANTEIPENLHQIALTGDLGANTMYYSMVGSFGADAAIATGAVLGLAAGVGALTLPEPMGLGSEPTNESRETQILTVGLYLAGGLTAGAVYRVLAK